MAEDPSTHQISVAELLARNGTIGAPAVTRRRRRRRGDSDAVTVAELTGEIPIIRDVPPDVPRDGVAPTALAAEVSPPAAQEQATAGYWSEPEPRWPKSWLQASCPPGPERSEYPRPLRPIGSDAAAAAGAPSHAEQMSPDPVEHYVDISVDVKDTEVREIPPASEDAVRPALSAEAELAQDPLDFAGDVVGETPAARRWADTISALWRGSVIVFQSLLAVVFGAGLFLAFDQLWRWNSIVALVLSVLVILGLVVGVRVVRKTEDIASTLIAVAVGALITLGPLALSMQSG